jgi:hypothetical protein
LPAVVNCSTVVFRVSAPVAIGKLLLVVGEDLEERG